MDLLREEAARGRTIVLTTQILSEAEELCDDILIIDNGRQVARGDLNALKLAVGARLRNHADLRSPAGRLRGGDRELSSRCACTSIRTRCTSPSRTTRRASSRSSTALAARGHVLRLEINGASLEDIFVELTGKGAAS